MVGDLAGRVFKSAINCETSNCLANRFAPAGKVYFIKSHLSSGQKSYRRWRVTFSVLIRLKMILLIYFRLHEVIFLEVGGGWG